MKIEALDMAGLRKMMVTEVNEEEAEKLHRSLFTSSAAAAAVAAAAAASTQLKASTIQQQTQGQPTGQYLSAVVAMDGVDEPSSRSMETAQNGSFENVEDDIQALLSAPSTKQKEQSEKGSEIHFLLNKKTSVQQAVREKFQSKGGTSMAEFCQAGTRDQCARRRAARGQAGLCLKVHFRRVLLPHTDVALGDCSYLDTCRHMAACRFVHYEIDGNDVRLARRSNPALAHLEVGGATLGPQIKPVGGGDTSLRRSAAGVPTQWLNCDVRTFDFGVLGQFDVIMADPPWDIHMDLPYGTMTDDEMRYKMPINKLQEEKGVIFLWVTGRAMELGRELLALWGYVQTDELVWIKTNQLQRIIRTGRTGHWLNHSKEHCLVGVKGDVKLNRNLDCDVLVSEVRETSRKPDEIYELIERLSPGTRKIEIFGRRHNIWPGWFTVGNQLPQTKFVDKDVIERYNKTYPENPYIDPDEVKENDNVADDAEQQEKEKD